jgi:S1-C subfamily serine protease
MARTKVGNTILGSILAVSICMAAAALAHTGQEGAETAVSAVGAQGASENDRAWVGIYFETVNRRSAAKFGYPHETGIVISMVVPGSPAAAHGLKDGDIVHSFGGAVIENAEHFGALVRERRANETVAFVVFRKGVEKKIDVRLGGQTDRNAFLPELGRSGEDALKSFQKALKSSKGPALQFHITRGRVGLLLRDLNDDLAAYFGAGKGEGALVLDVERGSPAGEAGIRSGDVIVRVNGDPAADASAAIEAISAVQPGDTVSLDVLRRGARRVFRVAVKPDLGDAPFRVLPFGGDAPDAKDAEKLRRLQKEDPDTLRKELEELKKKASDLEEHLRKVEKK